MRKSNFIGIPIFKAQITSLKLRLFPNLPSSSPNNTQLLIKKLYFQIFESSSFANFLLSTIH